jgi:hypothetical protein
MAKTTSKTRSKAVPFTNQGDVYELLTILRKNNVDTQLLVSVLDSVTAIERQLTAAAMELTDMRRELDGMREERGHPMQAALREAARSMSERIRTLRQKLGSLQNWMISGCQATIAAFRQGGVSALYHLTDFFNVQPALKSLRDGLTENIAATEESVAKIKAASEQFHAASRHVKNIGRAIRGEDVIADVKPNGKLSKLLETPFQAELRYLNSSLRNVNKVLEGMDKLEKAAEASRPSTLEQMKELRTTVEERKKSAPAQEKEQQAEAAI